MQHYSFHFELKLNFNSRQDPNLEQVDLKMEEVVVDFAFFGNEGGSIFHKNQCEYEEQKSESSDDEQEETDTGSINNQKNLELTFG